MTALLSSDDLWVAFHFGGLQRMAKTDVMPNWDCRNYGICLTFVLALKFKTI